MADELAPVQPGDLITAEKWNALVARVKGMSTARPITVPDLFGRALADARAVVQLPGSQLNLSQVIDAFGLNIDANDVANAQRRVLSQVPSGGAQVPAQTGVSLVVAAVATGAQPGAAPVIDAITPSTQQASGFVIITGKNFDTPAQTNTVLFDGVSSTPDDGTPIALRVRVPLGIPDVPASGGSKENVQVVVQNRLKQPSQPQPMTVQSPPAVLPPTIKTIAPQTGPMGVLGQPIVITGTDFGTDLAAIRVFFDGGPAGGVAPSAGSPESLTVTPPVSIAIGPPLSSHAYQVTVRVGDRTSNQVPFTLMVP